MSDLTSAAERSRLFSDRPTNNPLGTAMNAGMMWWDLATTFQREMQRASLQSFSSYSPSREASISGRLPQQAAGMQVVALGEERLNIATRTEQGQTTRLRRRVVAQPVEQQVTLRDETVVVERRAPTGAGNAANVLTETVIEMTDSRQVPNVWKSVHVSEEVVLRKQVTERTEKVRETVRHDVLEVEQPHAAPSFAAAARAEARREDAVREDVRHAAAEAAHDKPAHDEPHDRKPAIAAPQPQPAARKN